MTQPPSWPPPGQPDPPGSQAQGTPPPPPPYGAPPPPAPGPPGGPPAGWEAPQWGAPQYGYGQPYAQPYAVLAPKPGIIPLRPLSVSEILDGSFTTIRRHPKATLGLSAVVACLQQGLSLGLQALGGSVSGGNGFAGLQLSSRSNQTGADIARSLTTTFGSLLITLALSGILTGMLCLVVSDSVLGQPSSAGAVWRRVRPMAWRVLFASLLVAVVQIIGFFACLIPGVFLYGVWALVLPALVLERIGIVAAIRRSWRLAKPSFWRVLGIRLLGKVITTAVAAPFAVVTALVGVGDIFRQLDTANSTTTVHISATTVIVIALVSIITTTLTAPFVAGLLTLLYIDRRIRAEALDVQLAQAALNRPGGAAVPAPPAYG